MFRGYRIALRIYADAVHYTPFRYVTAALMRKRIGLLGGTGTLP